MNHLLQVLFHIDSFTFFEVKKGCNAVITLKFNPPARRATSILKCPAMTAFLGRDHGIDAP
jgi:hypothetical protein